MLEYKGPVWHFFWNPYKESKEYYKTYGTYKGLPRSIEMGVAFYDELGRGNNVIVAFYRAIKGRWIIR